MPDHYETLGVSQNATADEIRSAFRGIARQHHPDVSDSPASAERFLEAKDAYDVLSDPDRKRNYDIAQGHRREQEARQRRQRAHRASDASSRMRQAQAHRTRSAEALHLSMLLNQHKFNQAESLARQMLRDDPKAPLPYAVLADIFRARGDLQRAEQHYAYAAQYAPTNRAYRQKHIEMTEALALRTKQSTGAPKGPMALGVAAFVTLVSCLYVVLSGATPAFPAFAPISLWPLSLMVMLFVSGIAIGASLSSGGFLDVFDANRGSAVMRVPPAIALGMIALLNYWIAVVFYLFVGVTQSVFNPSMTRLLAATGAALAFFVVAIWIVNAEAVRQTALWGGNVLYLGSAVGWFVADSLKQAN
ncbi:MAG: DnaJ domain-containing protein [Armatimonadetes bacterium]|nr:DnaJ domain-containing protein [Armatimonadota bacterium]